MSAKRGASGLSGIALVDKPAGMTSHDVVDRLRRVTGERRIGHAGTLDPMATGLLVMLVGPATRLEPYLSSASKRYTATITFGSGTDTLDAEGEVIETAPVDPSTFERETAEGLLLALTGPSMQVPPAYSAIKRGGQVAHRVARAGNALELEPRAIEVFAATLLGSDADSGTWDVDFTVSKGTYVRSLARDLGVAAGTVAHLSALRRTASGSLTLESAHTLDDFESADDVSRAFIDPVGALGTAALPADEAAVAHGRAMINPDGMIAPGQLVALLSDEGLRALYRADADRLAPVVVFSTPVQGGAR